MNRKLILILCLLTMGSAVIAQAPVATITASATSGCAPLAVSFADGGSGATSWSWNFGTPAASVTPATSANRTAAVVYKDAGTYKVTLTTKNANGSTTATPVNIVVYPYPVADFTFDKTSGCFPTTVNFTDKSTPGTGATITSYTWDMGDGSFDYVKNPSHSYTFANQDTVTLYVTNSFGCTGNTSFKRSSSAISITGGITPDFSTTVTSNCALPATANFTNNTTGPATLSYSWNFDDASPANTFPSPSHDYNTAKVYNVTLTANSTQGCTASVTKPVNITNSGNNTDFTAPAKVCINSPVTFTNSSSPTATAATWNYGDGSPVDNNIDGSHTYTAAGTFTVTLNNTYGACSGSTSKQIDVVNPPVAAFTGTNLTSCKVPLTSTFTDQSTGANAWFWDFGDGNNSNLQNPSHTYTAPGNYTVTLFSNVGQSCSSQTQKVNYVQIGAPTVSLVGLDAQGCAPYPFTPSANVNAPDGVKTYLWDLGNGSTFTGQNPPPQVYNYGSDTIKLTITTNGGCTQTAKGTLLIGNIKPVPDFTATPNPVCADVPVQFTDKSTGNPDQWSWNFGDGVSGGVENPSHTYTSPGNFDVTLTASNHGCKQTVTKSGFITVNPPKSSFVWSVDCNNRNQFSFTDNSLMPLTWDWNFGDGSPHFNGQNPPTHVYPAGATTKYKVTLITTNNGCSDTFSDSITANQYSTIATATPTMCKNSPVVFTSKHPSNIVTYTYNFGDGMTAGSPDGNSSHAYASAGTYSVFMTTTDNVGCTLNTAPISVTITGPTAAWTTPKTTGCDSLVAIFTDKSTISGAPIKNWAWVFGDGGTSTVQNPAYTYKTQGAYYVYLTVTDANGCSDTYSSLTQMILSTPKASFTTPATNYCQTSSITVTNTSTGGFNPVYTWDFKDGSTSNAATPPPHSYSVDNDYNVSLSILDDYGCKSVYTMPKPIHIETPYAHFTASKTYIACPPDSVLFTFDGTYAATYSWTYGNGTISQNQNGKAFYTRPNTIPYPVTLTITSPGGCTSSFSGTVQVDGPVGTFSYSPLTGCNSVDVNFTVNTGNSLTFHWLYGDGSAIETTMTPAAEHVYNTPGQYIPVLKLEDSKGCVAAIAGTDTVKVDGIKNMAIITDKTIFCDNGTVHFKDGSTLGTNTVIVSYDWNFGDGSPDQIGLADNAVHIYNTPGSYTATLTIMTTYGCSSSTTVQITNVPSPVVNIGGIVDQCAPAVMGFNGIETGAPSTDLPLTWSWDFTNGITSNQQNPTGIKFPKGGNYPIKVTATTKTGCSGSYTATPALLIYAIPDVNAGNDATVCNGTPLALHATGSSATNFNWQPPTSSMLTCTACADPTTTPLLTDTYFIVKGTSPDGCVNQDTMNVKVVQPITVSVSGPDSVCLGQSTTLNASGAPIYSWSPATGLSNSNIADPVATPVASQVGVTNYEVTGYSDPTHCFTDKKTIAITTFNYPTVNLGPDVTIPVGTTYSIPGQVTGDIVSMQWTPTKDLSCTDCYTPVTASEKTISYSLSVVNNGSCAAADTVKITVVCDGKNFFIPNTFSPNGDGANDKFLVRGVGLTAIPSLQIFNRWGQLVFEKKNFAANDESAGWDGTFNGKPAAADVYIYTLSILCDNNTLIPYHGNVTLIR